MKAYDKKSDEMDWYNLHTLGSSYLYIGQNSYAGKYFELALDKDKEGKFHAFIYSGISELNLAVKNYDLAILNAEKAIALSNNNEDKSKYYALLSRIELDRERYPNSIEYLVESISYYITKFPKLTHEDIEKGLIKDKILSNLFFQMAVIYFSQEDFSRYDKALQTSAKLGNERAKEFCKERGIKYN